MKKIIKFYVTGVKYLQVIGLLMVLAISIGIGYVMGDGHGFIWGVLTAFGMFTVFIWKVNIDMSETKRLKEFLEKKYGDDPEWGKYKELKKKFNNS